MKISVLTSTYNRAKELERLYTSLVVNNNSNVDFEWLIMDDGSTDKTKLVVQGFIEQKIIDIKYFREENKGKMAATNELMKHVTGDICFTCDSDDYLVTGAFDTIEKYADKLLNDETVYALVFLKVDENGEVSGNKFPENFHRSDMFSLYFREEIEGEKTLVFKTDIRKRYEHILEADEKFATESRMYHKIDKDYDVICINEPLEVGDYQDDGYTKNILDYFKKCPLGHYMYFKEILEMDLTGVTFKKRMYVYKHYILFSNLAYIEHPIRNVKGFWNKVIITLLWIPGTIITKHKFMKDEKPKIEDKENKEKEAEEKAKAIEHKSKSRKENKKEGRKE